VNCEEVRELVHAYADGELDVARSVDFERHIANCESCAAALRNVRALKPAIRGSYYAAPDDLRASVLRFPSSPDGVRQSGGLPAAERRAGSWLLTGLAIAAALILGFFVGDAFLRRSANQNLLAEITDAHVRSLAANHLADVASSDQHTVRPWFEGKIDFAPPVEDLATAGFPLVGGRLEYLRGRPVAALVYQRRKHFVNLFIWPGDHVTEIRDEKPQRGYNIVHWANDGMTYFAVSEISAPELRQFARDFTTALSH